MSQVAAFVLFLPQFRLALRQVTTYTNPNLVPPTPTEFISRSWQAYTVGLTLDPWVAQPALFGLVIILLLASLLTFIIRRPSVVIRHHYLFLSGWFLIPLLAYYIVLQRQPSFEPRYLILITPALFLLTALLLTPPPTPHPPAPAPSLALVEHERRTTGARAGRGAR